MSRTLKKILYAEDDVDIQEVTVLALEALGDFSVETCDSGRPVVELAQRFQPDLVLLDVMMPGMDGPGAMQALHNTPGLDSIPVIFMTAKVMDDEVNRFMALGALGVISKPYDPVTLCDQISEIWRCWDG